MPLVAHQSEFMEQITGRGKNYLDLCDGLWHMMANS